MLIIIIITDILEVIYILFFAFIRRSKSKWRISHVQILIKRIQPPWGMSISTWARLIRSCMMPWSKTQLPWSKTQLLSLRGKCQPADSGKKSSYDWLLWSLILPLLRSCSLSWTIVWVGVVLKRTVAGDWPIDNVSRILLHSAVNSVCHSIVL